MLVCLIIRWIGFMSMDSLVHPYLIIDSGIWNLEMHFHDMFACNEGNEAGAKVLRNKRTHKGKKRKNQPLSYNGNILFDAPCWTRFMFSRPAIICS